MFRRDPANRQERGTTAVELSLLMPVLAVLIIGTIDLGRGVWIRNSLHHVAGEAVRRAAVASSTSETPHTESTIAAWVKEELPHLDEESFTIVTSWTPNSRPGSEVSVSLVYNFDPITPFLPFDSITLSSAARSVISY